MHGRLARHLEQVVPIGRQVDVEAAHEKIVTGTVVDDLRELILEVDDLAGELGEGQRDEPLGGLPGQVRDDEAKLPVLTHPQTRDDPGVALAAHPCGRGLEADRMAEPETFVVGRPQNPAVEVTQRDVRRLIRLA